MKNNYSYLIFCIVLFSLFLSIPVSALDTKYNRNGEVYFLIGEQNESGKPNPFKGIYRMNNPETNIPYPVGGVRYIKDISNTIGFTVDLDRYIYPFSENVPPTATQQPYIYRQVVDTASCDHVDYGLHAYFHDDYRNFNAGTDIYRSNVGRAANGKIRNVPLSRFKSLGPGEYVGDESNLPEGYVYIECTGNGRVVKQPNKPWYKIRNNRWYSCWKQGNTTGAFGGKFYWTVGDQEWSKIHKFMVNKWGPGPGFSELNQDKYVEIAAGKTEVGQTMDITVTRYCRAGCLDSCGNANGGGDGAAPTASASVAFQPAPTGSTTGDRAYFYTRVDGSTNYSLKYNGAKYPEASIIGAPKDLTTFWIGVSLKGLNDDFIYALGTNVIKDWYHAYTNSYQHNMQIKATAVSNQWKQEGGIVFAYDKANDVIYKFVRNDKNGLGTVDYEAIDCNELAKKVGSANNSFDDIKADGFGSLYFALSHPAKSVADGYDPTKKFKPIDAEHMCFIETTMEGNFNCDILFRQKYSKVIYKKDYLSGVISEIGRRDYAYKVYSIFISVPYSIYVQLKDLPWPNDKWYSIIKTAYDAAPPQVKPTISVGGFEPTFNSLQSQYFALGRDKCNHSPWPMYETFHEDNPGQTQLAVINVPTPPEVRHLGPYKVSYLDICGPYDSLPLPPVPNNERTTNQPVPTGTSNNLSPSTIYFYMVENYPLEDGAQDPKLTPDCDNDTRFGGFLSSITDPRTGENGGAVRYEWKLWLVEDPFGNKCCELYDQETNGSYSFPFWYYAKSKFILLCRVKYNWYDYDLLNFGDTVDKLNDIKKTSFAWPSDAGYSYDMATAAVRLNDIMNTSAFSFMKASNNPKDVEGNDIDYSSTILGNDTHYQYWAIEPIIVSGDIATGPEDLTLTASLERCDHIYKTNGTAEPLPASYLFKTGGASHWNSPESPSNCFTIETGKTFYWRMAIASQAKLFCDISNSTKVDESSINDEDFNMVAYLLSKEDINGKSNKNYVNSNPNLQFYPSEPGSCWWRQKKDKDGNLLPPEIRVQALLKYKLPDGTIRQVPLHDLTGTGAPITVPLQTGETALWQKNKPLYATMSATLDVPPTDPFVGTLTVELSRQYYFKMWILNNDGIRMKDIKIGPLTLALTAEASIRVLDTDKPEIVYNETVPINLFGLTGRALATNYAGESKTNPPNVAFALRDNNAWEATNETGITLYKHVENYMYNFGVQACERYTKGSDILEGYFNTAKGVLGGGWEGIRKQIQDAQNNENKSSHLNMRPLYSKFARDTRFVFDTSVRNLDGSISYGRGDTFKYNSGTKQYLKDDELFDGDNSSYAYNPGIKAISNLNFTGATTVDDGGNKYHAVMKYSMALGNIKIRNGINKVPEGYANNTPGYTPYQFYVRSTDCSGNYTFVNSSDNKINGYLPLNMALHVRDDIPPIPYGSVKEFKKGNEYFFPQKNGDIASSTESPLAFSVVNISGSSAFPEYYGMDLNEDFLRQNVWCSDNNITGYFKNDNSHSYKALLSFCDTATTENDLSIASGDTVKNKTNFINQLKNRIAPYYIEDNVECVFKAYSTDNAGYSAATLSFKYYTTDNPSSNDVQVGKAFADFTSSGVTTSQKIASSSVDASAMFRGPIDKFPLAIPIMIVSEDDAKEWDEYTGYNANPTDPTKAANIWGSLKKGGSKPNRRLFLSSLVVFYSVLDIRTLEKTLRNN